MVIALTGFSKEERPDLLSTVDFIVQTNRQRAQAGGTSTGTSRGSSAGDRWRCEGDVAVLADDEVVDAPFTHLILPQTSKV